MSWKTFVAGYLHFSKKDRIGVLVLIALIAIIYALPYLMPSKVAAPIVLDDSMHHALDNLQPVNENRYANKNYLDKDFDYNPAPSVRNDFTKGELFSFNPNTLDAEGWRRLGLSLKTVRTIMNYRSKGGRFYKKEDLQKIWGLPDGFYERVEDHISIPPRDNNYTERPVFNKRGVYEKAPPRPIDINTADTGAWIALPGIGSKLAGRIVAFRNKLGGFHSVEQVGTTYGLPDSTFQKIKPLLSIGEHGIDRININTATKEQLSAHPYINWKLAAAVVAYREQHGRYASVADLKKIMIMDEATFEKLMPYISVQ